MFFSLFRQCCRSTTVVNEEPEPEPEQEQEPAPAPVPYPGDGTRWRPSLPPITEEDETESSDHGHNKKKIKFFNKIVKRFR